MTDEPPVLSDDELDNRIKGVVKGKQEDEKRAKGIREQVSLDPKIYEIYSYFKNEEGYTGSFNQFLTDFILDSAKEKGYDIQVVKSARSGRFIRGNSNNKEDKEIDDYESALSILGMGSSNPKEQALKIAIESKQQEIEQKRLQNMQLQMQIENQRLELERKKIENEKLRKEMTLPPQAVQQAESQSEIYKMMMDYNQKMFEVLAKAKDSGMEDNFMKYLLDQNQKTNNMIVGLLSQQNEKKLQELENAIYSTSADQQLEKFKKQYELFKELGIAGGGLSPEQLQKDYELKLRQMEIEREDKKQERDERRAEHLTEVIKDAFTQFSQTIGEPIGRVIAEQTKQRINNMVPPQKPPEQQVAVEEKPQAPPPVPTPPPPPPVQEVPVKSEQPEEDTQTS